MKFEFSAGGIVYKKESGKTLVLVAQHSQHHGWVFPKGLIGDHPSTHSASSGQAGSGQVLPKGKRETKEEAALREVEEETGAIGKIIKPLPPVTYWYVWEGEKRKKTVYYFLMGYVSGDITNHDMEMENVEWVSLPEVEKRLTYKSDKEIWGKAKRDIV